MRKLRQLVRRLLARAEPGAAPWAEDVAHGPLPVRNPGTHWTRSESVCQPRSGCVCGSQPLGCAASQSGGEGPC